MVFVFPITPTRSAEETIITPETVELKIDWVSATNAFKFVHEIRKSMAISATHLREISKARVPVIMLATSKMSDADGDVVLRITDAGYFAVDTSHEKYNFHITGNNWTYRKSISIDELLAVKETSPIINAGRDGGWEASFTKFGADYIVEVYCAAGIPCISKAATIKLINSMIVVGGLQINRK